MQVKTVSVGPLQTNCYIVYLADGTAAVIDPGDDTNRILRAIRDENFSVKGIWLTHGHFDHIGAVKALKETFECPIIACNAEKPVLLDPMLNLSLDFLRCPLTVTADLLYQDGDTFALGDKTVTVLHTPGHTAGSCCFAVDGLLFSGDTLFERSMGRVDFPTGDLAAMMRSLKRLAALPGEYTVLPGHGAATSLQAERMMNPYMKQEF